MLPDLSQLRKNYENLNDSKLIALATQDATSLRPEALELLKQVLKERGLSSDLEKGIEAQLQANPYTIGIYADLLRKQPCPISNSSDEKLNATMTTNVISFILMTQRKKKLIVACPDCLDKANNDAIMKTAIVGWWGFPWGIIRTIQALISNNKMKKQNRLLDANDLFLTFVEKRIGLIEVNKNSPEHLQLMIQSTKA
jgi:hypothetical protein